MSRAYLNSVRSPRITLRTVARDTESALTISLIEHPCSKYARRISPILSTPNIPHPSFPADPGQRKNAHTQVRRGRYWTRKQPFRGSLLQAILQPETRPGPPRSYSRHRQRGRTSDRLGGSLAPFTGCTLPLGWGQRVGAYLR